MSQDAGRSSTWWVDPASSSTGFSLGLAAQGICFLVLARLLGYFVYVSVGLGPFGPGSINKNSVEKKKKT